VVTQAGDDQRVEGQAGGLARCGTLRHQLVLREQSMPESSPRTATRLALRMGRLES
jgi:hypothetical protein